MTSTLIRPAVLALPAYDVDDGTEEGTLLRAHRNEAALTAPQHVLDAVRALDGALLGRYPVDLMRGFSEALARRLGSKPQRLAIGNGADEILAAIGRVVLDPGDAMVTVTPTFGMYARVAGVAGARLRTLPYARRWELDVDALLVLAAQARLVVLGHPNNPTGELLSAQTLARVARALPQALIVVDEVYLSLGAGSLAAVAAPLPNVVVVGSLSKVASLAGMRVGYAVGRASIASAIRRVIPPFPVGAASLVAADAYVRGGAATAAFEAALSAQVRRSLDAIESEIGCFAIAVWRGAGNFVLMNFGTAAPAIATALRARGIAVRAFCEPELTGCLRFCALDNRATSRLIAAVREVARDLGLAVRRA